MSLHITFSLALATNIFMIYGSLNQAHSLVASVV